MAQIVSGFFTRDTQKQVKRQPAHSFSQNTPSAPLFDFYSKYTIKHAKPLSSSPIKQAKLLTQITSFLKKKKNHLFIYLFQLCLAVSALLTWPFDLSLPCFRGMTITSFSSSSSCGFHLNHWEHGNGQCHWYE